MAIHWAFVLPAQDGLCPVEHSALGRVQRVSCEAVNYRVMILSVILLMPLREKISEHVTALQSLPKRKSFS